MIDTAIPVAGLAGRSSGGRRRCSWWCCCRCCSRSCSSACRPRLFYHARTVAIAAAQEGARAAAAENGSAADGIAAARRLRRRRRRTTSSNRSTITGAPHRDHGDRDRPGDRAERDPRLAARVAQSATVPVERITRMTTTPSVADRRGAGVGGRSRP